MFLVYIDESGDDGFPSYSSPIFVLTACYFKEESFHSNFNLIKDFRKNLKDKYGLYTGIELHLRELIQNKKPYTGIGLTKDIRQKIVEDIFDFIAIPELDVKFINVAIDKTGISNTGINILDTTLKYLIRRIDNDMRSGESQDFLCISDEGRVQIMNKTARKMRKIAFVPSLLGGTLGNKPISLMVEDILEKSSKESYFIQLSDCVSRIINLYTMRNICNPHLDWSRKTRKFLSYGDEIRLLDKIKKKLNLKASSTDIYGIKYV